MSAREQQQGAGPAVQARSRAAPPRWVLPAILALAVALRLLAWHRATLMNNDGPDFLWQTEHLLAGDTRTALSHPYHPLYALATAGIALVTRDVVGAALAVSILSALLIVIAVRSLARSTFPARPWAAEAAALIAALHGRLLITTSDIQSDGLCLALLGAACAVLFAEIPGRVRQGRLLLAGLLTGLAYLARPEGLFVIGAAVLWWAAAVRDARRGVRAMPPATASATATGTPTTARADVARATTGLIVFLFGAGLIALPYVLVIHDITGRWGLSLKPSVAAAGLSEAAEEHALPADCPLASPLIHRAPADAVTASPPPLSVPPASSAESALAAADAAPALPDMEQGDELPDSSALGSLAHAATSLWFALRADMLLLALAGLVTLWPRHCRHGGALALLALAWLVAGALQLSLSHYLGPRHLLVAVVLLLPLAGAGFAWAWNAARAMSGARRAALLLLLVAILVTQAAAGVSPRRRGNPARLEALAWAREHTAPGARLAVHHRKDAYYAQRPVLVMLDLPVRESELRDKLVRYHVALLVLDLESVQRFAPQWLADGRFTERARFGEGDDVVIVLEPAGA